MSTKKRATKLKVMHTIGKDKDGNNTITSIVSNPPKLREAVGPDKVQAAEKHGHKLPPLPPAPKVQKGTAKKPKTVNVNGETALKVLSALSKLGGTSESMPIAKELGFDKKYPKAPRGHVRTAMEHLSKAGFVKSKKTGMKYEFTITDKGKEHLANPPKHEDKKEPAKAQKSEGHASNPSNVGLNEGVLKAVGHVVPAAIRPANTDKQCAKCQAWNPFGAEFCKNCGAPFKAEAVAVAA